VAHDLNNALAPILMASSLLRGRHPESREIIATVESCTERCADMVRQLLTFARGSDGARVLVRPNDLLREMARIVRGTFPKNIELRLSAAPDVSVVRGDPTQLHQVLLNLCVNARDAMPEGGVLSMSVHNQTVDKEFAGTVAEARPGLHVVLEVSDTGVGIAPEVVDQVFDPFFTTKSPDQGTGLGLSTVLGIVKGHGGFIRLESQPGRGTRFFVFLPAAEDDEEVRTAGPANTGCRPFGRDRTLLLVDDELNIRTILSVVLRQLGFRVLTAGNGEEARELAAAHFAVIQGVVTDLNMPRLGGVKLIRALREWLPSIPVLVSTGRLEPGVEQELGFLGVRNILTKPFNKELLVRALQEALGPGESGMRSVEGTAP
jgi:CheY-like chemotaxis protein